MKILRWILALIPLGITAAVLPLMPERVPMHYDIEGAVDRVGSRNELLFMPLLIIAIVAVSTFVTKHYSRRAEETNDGKSAKAAETNAKTLNVISLAVPVFFGILQSCILYMTYKNARSDSIEVNSDLIVRVVYIVLGIMFALCGFFMPKVERNNMFGFRTTWSMYNDNTWRRCNRVGGVLFIVLGLLLILTSALVPATAITFLMLGYLVTATAALMVYSYNVYKEERAGENKK